MHYVTTFAALSDVLRAAAMKLVSDYRRAQEVRHAANHADKPSSSSQPAVEACKTLPETYFRIRYRRRKKALIRSSASRMRRMRTAIPLINC